MVEGATRATGGVALLVRWVDTLASTAVVTRLCFAREVLRDLVFLIAPDDPSRKPSVHLVWAGEMLRPSYTVLSPTVEEAMRGPEGFWVLDMHAVGLVDDRVRGALPMELAERLGGVIRTPE